VCAISFSPICSFCLSNRASRNVTNGTCEGKAGVSAISRMRKARIHSTRYQTTLVPTAVQPHMASHMPLPVPPRTPTPPPNDAPRPLGLGLDGELAAGQLGHDVNALSPMSATFPSKQYATLRPSDSASQRATPIFTPASATFPHSAASTMSGAGDVDAENSAGPFNFQPTTYMPGRPQPGKSVCPGLMLSGRG
jgi:hypothetical protein